MEFPHFSGHVYKSGDTDYELKRYQYATTSQPAGSMSPAAIIYPQHDKNPDSDVEKAIHYAREHDLGIAVRTGGHAYSGTSSTSGRNIQLDLSEAYFTWEYDEMNGRLRVGVSHSLFEFNTRLKKAGLFMPTGQCYDVHVGGHAQTGGYGQLSRAFGLFGDQIVSFEIFLADGKQRTVAADSPEPFDQDLFFAVLGGGPGNYGIVTHITVRPYKDSDHSYARAFKKVIPYDPTRDHKVLVKLFDLVKEWENAPSDYDFCFTVAAGEEEFIANQIGLASKDDFMVTYFGGKNHSSPFDVVMVYFQYSNLDNKPNTYDPKWCNKIEAILNTANKGGSWWAQLKRWFEQKILNRLEKQDNSQITRMSTSVTELWTYEGTREFNYPFLKYGQVTDKVATDEWSEWAAKRIDMMTGRRDKGLMIFVQCQNFGGKHSAVTRNGERKQTAYSWRNTTIGCNLDLFYDPNKPNAPEEALKWHKLNVHEGVGTHGRFSVSDHRWIWATHDNLNMQDVWQYYYSAEDYARCCAVKAKVDPQGMFTANIFAVGYDPNNPPKHLGLPDARSSEVGSRGQPQQALDDAVFTRGHVERARQRARRKGIDLSKSFR